MSSSGNTNPGNFANRPTEEVIEIAKKGGQASHGGGSASVEPETTESSTGITNPGNFANRPKEEVVEIAKKGGQASHGGGSTTKEPETTGNTNPGNFANRPKDEVSEIAKKGGQASHSGGFASMDPEKQVTLHYPALEHLAKVKLTIAVEENCIHGGSGIERII